MPEGVDGLLMVARQITIQGLDDVRALMSPARFARDISLIHRQLALKSVGFLIRTCSVDTGRARAGFLALFVRHGFSAAKYLAGGVSGVRRTAGQGRSASAEEEGRALSSVTEAALAIRITNGVQYVEYINSGVEGAGRGHNVTYAGTHFIDIGLDRTLDFAQRVMDWYAGRIRELARDQVRGSPDENPEELS